MVGVVAALSVIDYRGRIVQIDAQVKQIMTASLPHVRSKGRGPSPESRKKGLNWGLKMEVRNGILSVDDPALFLLGWERHSQLVLTTDNIPEVLRPYTENTSIGENFKAMTLEGYRVVRINDRYDKDSLLMWAGYDLSAVNAAMQPFVLKTSAVALLVWCIVMTAGWFIIGHGLKFIDRIRASAERIEGGDFKERIDVDAAQNELSALAVFLNRSFDRLEMAYQQQVLYTAEASHELRTPLSVVLSRAQLVLRKEQDAKTYREALRTCVDSTQHMVGLVEGLQLLTQMEASVLKLRKESTDLAELASEMIELLMPLAEESSITLVPEVHPCTCPVDVSQMQQVFVNLIGNAIKYGRPNDRVTIRTQIKADKACIEIQDTGCGISPEDLPHIFERFYRVDKSHRIQEGASGLGLTICKQIIEAHGGTIEVSSKIEVGTRFTIQIPVSA